MDNNELGVVLRDMATSMQYATRLQQETFLANLLRQDKYSDRRHLAHYEHQVFSQNGEDGAIQEIFRRIGTDTKTFVEIGVGHGLENNTVYFLSLGWRGLWIEGDQARVPILQHFFGKRIAQSALIILNMYVTRENIAEALQKVGVTERFDLLSLDVDQNTYWVWQALAHLRPRVAVIEYNATYPPTVNWKAAYNPQRIWDKTFYFGASLKAFELLGADLGYCLVGCDLSGTNAYFVRKDLCGDHFVKPFDAETHYEPMRLYLTRLAGAPRGPGIFME